MSVDLALPGAIGDFEAVQKQVALALSGVRGVTQAVVAKQTLQAAQWVIQGHLFAQLTQVLTDTVEVFTMTNGAREGDGNDPDDWDSKLDDVVCNDVLTGDIEAMMGKGFCGEKSVDTRLHEPGRPEEFARELAQEIAKELVAKSGELILGYFDLAGLVPQPPTEAMPATVADFKPIVVNILRDYMAANPNYDITDMMDAADLAADDEGALAAGGLQRLGVKLEASATAHAAFAAWRRHDRKWFDEAFETASRHDEVRQEARTPAPKNDGFPELPASLDRRSEKPKRKTKAEKAAAEEAELLAMLGDDPINHAPTTEDAAQAELIEDVAELKALLGGERVAVESVRGGTSSAPAASLSGKATKALTILRNYGKLSDAALALAMGLKRGTMVNIIDGKSTFEPTPAQVDKLRELVAGHFQAMNEAQSLLR